jgi:ArsR family metal-binding transcriptional regulator
LTTCEIDIQGIEMNQSQCRPGENLWSATACLKGDLSGLLPYLNAELESARYDPKAGALLWDSEGKHYVFRSDRIFIAPVDNRPEAEREARRALGIVRDVALRKDRIQPDHTAWSPPTLMEVFQLLPRENCGECGSPTCLAFATRLREQDAGLDMCPRLCTDDMRNQRAKLGEILGAPRE